MCIWGAVTGSISYFSFKAHESKWEQYSPDSTDNANYDTYFVILNWQEPAAFIIVGVILFALSGKIQAWIE